MVGKLTKKNIMGGSARPPKFKSKNRRNKMVIELMRMQQVSFLRKLLVLMDCDHIVDLKQLLIKEVYDEFDKIRILGEKLSVVNDNDVDDYNTEETKDDRRNYHYLTVAERNPILLKRYNE